jgi:hypothetical protein
LNDDHFDAVLEHLLRTLWELKVAPELIFKIGSIVESTRDDILGRSPELFYSARGGL